jgi:UDP-4-amino-4,6-dideoxy-N-acetyl-beta-L-altrosamine N-acetyltransferase
MLKIEFVDAENSNQLLRSKILMWRNSDQIRHFMYQDKIITEEEHARWFLSLHNNTKIKYWVMHVNGIPAGLINIANIDAVNKSCEWAFYIGEIWAQKLGLGRIAEYELLNYVFFKLDFLKLKCAVLEFNKAVLNMHKSFGFKEEGFLREEIERLERRFGIVLLGMTRIEWEKVRAQINEKRLKSLGQYSIHFINEASSASN